MSIRELYGIRITDRVTISQVGRSGFQVFFDGEYINTAHSGPAAVGMAKAWLEQRQKQREAEARADAEEQARAKQREEHCFLNRIASQLDLERDDLDDLIALIKRRIKEDDDV